MNYNNLNGATIGNYSNTVNGNEVQGQKAKVTAVGFKMVEGGLEVNLDGEIFTVADAAKMSQLGSMIGSFAPEFQGANAMLTDSQVAKFYMALVR